MNLAIIGNGFDIAHGYKTGYKDFVENIGDDFFDTYKQYIHNYCKNSENWYLFEDYAQQVAASIFPSKMCSLTSTDSIYDEVNCEAANFNRCFFDIQDKLLSYLDQETTGKPITKISSIENVLDSNSIALNFNYTSTAEAYTSNIFYVHGSISEGEIVLGYDPPNASCIAPYNCYKLFKLYLREMLSFKRYIQKSCHIKANSPQYVELCQEYEVLQSIKHSGRGLCPSDFSHFLHADILRAFESGTNNQTYSSNIAIPYDKITQVTVLGHSLLSDKYLLNDILSHCRHIDDVTIFIYSGEPSSSIKDKASFFTPYCSSISFIPYQ